MKTLLYVFLVSTSLAACSGGGIPVGQATFATDGPFDGGYQVTSSRAVEVTRGPGDGGVILSARIYLYDDPAPTGACPRADAGPRIPSTQIVALRINSHFAGGIAPGVFPLFDPTNVVPVDWPLGEAEIDLIDTSRPPGSSGVASSVSGSVTLTEVGETWTGTFSGTIGMYPGAGAGHSDLSSFKTSISGSFNAPLCLH